MDSKIDEEIREIILTLWDKSVNTATYNKSLWQKLVQLLQSRNINI